MVKDDASSLVNPVPSVNSATVHVGSLLLNSRLVSQETTTISDSYVHEPYLAKRTNSPQPFLIQ